MKLSRLIAFGVICVMSASVSAQGLSKFCLNDESAGEALELASDEFGDIHLSRILSSSRELVYTMIGPDGSVTNEIITGPVSPFVGQRLIQTDIEMQGAVPYICFRDKLLNRMKVASKSDGQWLIETVQSDITGDGCSLALVNGSPEVVYEASGKLNRATRVGANNWQWQTIDSVSGERVGRTPDLYVGATGDRVVVHRNQTQKVLRITEYTDGVWRTVQADHGYFNGGLEPRVAVSDAGTVEVFHGLESTSLGAESDVGLLRTTGLIGGAYSSTQVSGTSIGGSVDAMLGGKGLVVVTRQLIRSALFGSFDALILLENNLINETRLENYGPADGRHVFQFIRLDPDPFGYPILAFFDSQSAFAAAREVVCLYRPIDSDGDRLPDAIEEIVGTNPNLADTDGDGRTDGEEILIDDTDPLLGDQCIPSAEICDGVDQDCDQRIDEQLERGCYAGPLTTLGQGVCRSGTQSCQLGEWGSCIGQVTPTQETCSGLDEDCDGATDETFSEQAQPCVTGLSGACSSGTTICSAGRLSCNQTNFPADDICSGLDEDCDGSVDEGTITCGTAACFNEVPRCVEGQDNICTPLNSAPTDSTCNGLDDDCDGRIDEDFQSEVTECGIGACTSQGTLGCLNGAFTDSCQPLEPSVDDTCDLVDQDCDGRLDEGVPSSVVECGVGACKTRGVRRCIAGSLEEQCTPSLPVGIDDTCDGVDDDCDGSTDEAFGTPQTSCGVGVCQAAGTQQCTNGVVVDNCAQGEPTGIDSCNGLDDDCDGLVDEAFVAETVECGEGLCANFGTTVCDGGQVLESCEPFPADTSDGNCDGLDQDCDGVSDEDFRSRQTSCGVGLCAALGTVSCVDGQLVDDCEPGRPVGGDITCDGLDGDCDGIADEGVLGRLETCGVGACTTESRTRCVDGSEISTCEPSPPASNDASCDGIDSDCDGKLDEDYVSSDVECGEGACRSTGIRYCADGAIITECEPQAPTNDNSCDGVDQDCDGRLDEGYEVQTVVCGIGQCQRAVAALCVAGQVQTCEPGQAAAADSSCDGVDDDCDGTADEDVIAVSITCGLGECQQDGERRCIDGSFVDQCEPLQPTARDLQCDGKDGDCDGKADEHYVGPAVDCGLGACRQTGQFVCENGRPVESCVPIDSAEPDDQCNGIDDDCDGRIDESYVPVGILCGVGLCQQSGTVECVAGVLTPSCEPGQGLTQDLTCDSVDDDCDGVADEDFVGESIVCGAGVCERSAFTRCIEGLVQSGCVAGNPSGDDEDCDGLDQDCDGKTDESYQLQPSTCGEGSCQNVGEIRCVDGSLRDSCKPLSPVSNGDLCDGFDDDCDGRVDEDHVLVAVECGVGNCRNTGTAQCINGVVSPSCTPLDPGPADVQCDGIDTDCDGKIDEDYVTSPTQCGQGICQQLGARVCTSGRIVDTCIPIEPTELLDECDGLDVDCDGFVDEDHQNTLTRCGEGVCSSTGRLRCIANELVDSCLPNTSSGVDNTCNGRDEDCDGRNDEHYQSEASTCGSGVCSSVGSTQCVSGRITSDCRPTFPQGPDIDCDGLDQDCDGKSDEAFTPRSVACGNGVCASQAIESCLDGERLSNCVPKSPLSNDGECNGLDDDCDGTSDEAVEVEVSNCGLGVCRSTGEKVCRDGIWLDSCVAKNGIGADFSCDGTDQDCDGRLDESYPSQQTICGVGACASEGATACLDGEVINTCEPEMPTSLNDETCDGVDDDCDTRVDENFQSGLVECGVGACTRRGSASCADGNYVTSCEVGLPAPIDAQCDGVDEDCDGRLDEDYQSVETSCGEGICQSTGTRTCQAGVVVDSCVSLESIMLDENCNGLDDDCDGLIDEGFQPEQVACGIGVCQRNGLTACENGQRIELCDMGEREGIDDDCDGLDQDCDGRSDESYQTQTVVCGVGACERDGLTECRDGVVEQNCRPGIPRDLDEICDGVDEDCDGVFDENCPDRPWDATVIIADGSMDDVGSDGDAQLADALPREDFDLVFCADGGFCIDGFIEGLCEGRACDAFMPTPGDLLQPIDSGCDCVQSRKVPFTWIGVLVCALLGVSRRRWRR